ncbi:MAG: putative sporulation protein, partial [Ilumatobacteraceae bacterium]|nr:putative sporulation protein [Ilumatobacteraceae bacterium]
ELEGYLDALGHRLDPPLLISSTDLRDSQMLAGKAQALHQPSVMFDLLARADASAGSRHSHRYYELALHLAHVAAALDFVPSPDEIDAIGAFRTTMLDHLDSLGVPRPGQPAPSLPPVPVRAPTRPVAVGAPAEAAVQVDLPPARTMVDLLAELDGLVGLANVKGEVARLTSMLQVQQIRTERGLPTVEVSKHLVFSGNPGTGKTTVARLLSQIYRAIGVVSKGHLVETDRSKLVAGYVGQTALKTEQTLEASLGGMLLIDEAYALARGGENDFGREAIDTLVKFMEDHRDDLAIVAAGYIDEMHEFIDTNPGLKSRFTRTVTFPDYTSDELVTIFVQLGEKSRYDCSDDALARVRSMIDAEPRTRGFGNARFVRNLFETAVAHQAMRLAPLTDPSDEQLTTLTAVDIVPVDN